MHKYVKATVNVFQNIPIVLRNLRTTANGGGSRVQWQNWVFVRSTAQVKEEQWKKKNVLQCYQA